MLLGAEEELSPLSVGYFTTTGRIAAGFLRFNLGDGMKTLDDLALMHVRAFRTPCKSRKKTSSSARQLHCPCDTKYNGHNRLCARHSHERSKPPSSQVSLFGTGSDSDILPGSERVDTGLPRRSWQSTRSRGLCRPSM